MAKEFMLTIITPEKRFFSGMAETLVFMTSDGEVGVMADHAPIIAALVPAPLKMKLPGQRAWREAAVTGGFVQVANGEVNIFASAAEWPEEIEEARALEAKERAEQRMQQKTNEIEYMRSRVALSRALTRLDVKKHSINH